jgi:hypothetical protein
MANIHPEALVNALAAAAKTPPPAPAGQGADAAASQAPTSAPGAVDQQAPDAGQAGAPTDQGTPAEQAVWQEFPATDPTQVEQLAQSAQGAAPDEMVQLIASFMQQAQADTDKLSQMHEAMAAHLIELLQGAGPTQGGQPEATANTPPMGPGVGGQGTGY